jgi:Ca2+-binding RTX toxin-like protein
VFDVSDYFGFNPNNLTLSGGEGNDTLSLIGYTQFTGHSIVSGGAGDDVIRVSSTVSTPLGATLTAIGGSGVDTYQFNTMYVSKTVPVSMTYTIADFQAGEGGDRIDLNGLLDASFATGAGYKGGNPFDSSVGTMRLTQSGSDTLLQFDIDGVQGVSSYFTVLKLENVDASTLTAFNFGGASPDGAKPVTGMVFNGTAGNDYLSGGWFNDTLIGGDGNDTLSGGAGSSYLDGGSGDDSLVVRAGSGANTLLGGDGNDSLSGAGVNYMDGGAGADSLINLSAGGNNTLIGGDGNDTIQAVGGTADGGAGDDSFVVSARFDAVGQVFTMTGGTGRDTYGFVTPYDVMRGVVADFSAGPGGDLIDVRGLLSTSSIMFNGYRAGDNPFSTDSGYLRLVQNGADTVLEWDIDGRLGSLRTFDEVLRLKDVQVGDITAANFVEGLPPNGGPVSPAEITGSDGNDKLIGGDFGNKIDGGAGDDSLIGGALGDTLLGAGGNDTLEGGIGSNMLEGGAGDDTLVSTGTRFNSSQFVNEKLGGGDGNDTFEISSSNDSHNALVADGGSGDDVFLMDVSQGRYSSPGKIVLTGGAGVDTYLLTSSFYSVGQFVITDFAAGAGGDRFDVASLAAYSAKAGGYSGGDMFQLGYLRYVQTASGTQVQYDYDGAAGKLGTMQTIIDLANVTAARITSANYASAFLEGSFKDELLVGAMGDDTLVGDAGSDTMKGGDGNDIYRVNGATNVVVELANNGIDRIETTLTSYTLGANVEQLLYKNDRAFAGTGNELANLIEGGTGNDTLLGGAGDDRIDAVRGIDLIDGGTGNDTAVLHGKFADYARTVLNAQDTRLVNAATGETVTLRGIESIVFADGTKALAAVLANLPTAGNDRISGTPGADLIDGGAGNDSMSGGAGDDRYVVGEAGDVVTELVNEGRDTVQTTLATYTLGANAENLVYSGNAGNVFNGTGNELDNVIGLGAGSAKADGGAGNDTVEGLGNFASYTVTRTSAADTLLTHTNGATVTMRNIETLVFADGSKTIGDIQNNVATPWNDLLTGTERDDLLNGGAGADTLSGGLGNDRYVVDNVGDVIVENTGEGSDTVDVALATAGTYVMGDNVENAAVTTAALAVNVTGNARDNLITGNAAANALSGGAGNDTLEGMEGADKLNGGSGDDVYIVRDAGDVVTELDNGGTDTVLTFLTSYTLGAYVENLTHVDRNFFIGIGNALDNVLSAWRSGRLDGGGGVDIAQVRNAFASYVITRPNATETVLKDDLGNLLTLTNIEIIRFADGDKTIGEVQFNMPSGGDDKLSGTAGNDVLNGGLGIDTLTGGAGDDTYVVANAATAVIENAGEGIDLAQVALTAAGTYALAANVENAIVTSAATVAANLTGNELNNLLTGNAAANTLLGGAGNDKLDGGAGSDKLSGGSGDDTYVVDAAGDVVTELANEGSDTVETTLASYVLGANVENLGYRGLTAFNGKGNELGNVITGGNGGATLDGAGGNDTLTGGSGNDSLQGGVGDDVHTGGGGKDTIDGGVGVDTALVLGNVADYVVTRPNATDTVLTGPGGNVVTLRNVETIRFADGDKTIGQIQFNIASVGNDKLTGTAGDDVLNGGLGVDTLAGGAGDDTYVITNAATAVVEDVGGGIDLAQVALTAAGTYVLAANVENATVTSAATVAANLTGNELNNLLTGNAATNTLTGGAGDDTLVGGAGNDKLVGGSGDDTYMVTEAGDVATELANEGSDTVETNLASYVLGANMENLSYKGLTAFNGKGNELANRITVGNGGATLDGAAGNDTLTGGSGNDSLQGGVGDDVLVAGGGKDTIDGGVGGDTAAVSGNLADYAVTRPNATDTVLTGPGGNVVTLRNIETVRFADGDKTIDQIQFNIASVGNDKLTGTGGNDVLNGGQGVDTLTGGAGDDTYVIANAATAVVEDVDGGADLAQVALTAPGTYVLAANVENGTVTSPATVAANLTGNELDNVLTGNAAANTLTGGAGNDTLIGGVGSDVLKGGIGDDTYVVADAGDTVTELAGEGTDTVWTSRATYTLTANVENLAYTGAAAFTGNGNALDNVITGSSAGNKLDGGAGNDQLAGGAGADNLIGGLGDDTIIGSPGKDTIDGGAGTDVLLGLSSFAYYVVTRPNATDTVLTDSEGNVITVRGVENFAFADGVKAIAEVQDNTASFGNDALLGTGGNDTLDGGLGNDTMTGAGGDDTYILSAATDVVIEQAGGGNDTVRLAFGAAGTYTMAANVETAIVTSAAVAVNVVGSNLGVRIVGNAAANKLTGGDGVDTLDGGTGKDTLTGGGDGDTYLVDDAGDVIVEAQAASGADQALVSAASYIMAANLEKMSYTGAGKFAGTGNSGDNVIDGGASTGATLDGGVGNDTLRGGSGNDSLIGGAGDDLIDGRGGKDTIDGGVGDDRVALAGALGDYTVARPSLASTVLTDKLGNVITVRNVEHFDFSSGGALTLAQVQNNVTSVGGDGLTGTSGDDVIDGGAGNDTLTGGLGDDIYVLDRATDVVVEEAGGGIDGVRLAFAAAGSYVLTDNVENATVTAAASAAVTVTGNELDNILTGNAAANTLIGGLGNDTLNGGAGNDSLVGGAGDDVYVVDVAGDRVVEAANGGYDRVEATAAGYTLAANVEDLLYTGKLAFVGGGNELANNITGGIGADVLSGAAGDDVLTGGAGADRLVGGIGADTFVLDSLVGFDTIADFVSGTDHLRIGQAGIALGNGDAVLDGGVLRNGPGGFGSEAELVVFSQRMATATTANAAKAIGSADGAYAVGQTVLFAVSTTSATSLYLFKSNGNDAVVSAAELTQVAVLTGTPTTALADYMI